MFGATAEQNAQHKVEQTPEQLLERAVQAIGGRKQLRKIESFQLHGVIRLPDDHPVVEVELATRQGGLVLGVMTYIGVGQSRFGSDGTTSWEQNLDANNGLTWNIIDSNALSQKVQQMNWLEWFTMLPLQLEYMEVVGDEVFDGEPCWKVQVETDEAKNQTIFFSKQTHRPKGRRTIEQTNGEGTAVKVYFRDWERVGDLLLFHKVIFESNDTTVTMKLDRIVLNKAKKDMFHLPEQIKLLRDNQIESAVDASD